MGAAHQDLIAIDVLLVPDRATIDKSISLNAQLRANYPTGYALDATRIPHLTLLQRFVPAKDFEAVCAIITNVLDDEPPTAMTLTATSIDSVSFEGLAVAVLVVERTPKLMRLHQEITDAVVPFSVGGGSPAAFADAKVAAGTVDWVETFVPKSSGKNYQPHITAGIAAEAFVAHAKSGAIYALRIQGGCIGSLSTRKLRHCSEEALGILARWSSAPGSQHPFSQCKQRVTGSMGVLLTGSPPRNRNCFSPAHA